MPSLHFSVVLSKIVTEQLIFIYVKIFLHLVYQNSPYIKKLCLFKVYVSLNFYLYLKFLKDLNKHR